MKLVLHNVDKLAGLSDSELYEIGEMLADISLGTARVPAWAIRILPKRIRKFVAPIRTFEVMAYDLADDYYGVAGQIARLVNRIAERDVDYARYAAWLEAEPKTEADRDRFTKAQKAVATARTFLANLAAKANLTGAGRETGVNPIPGSMLRDAVERREAARRETKEAITEAKEDATSAALKKAYDDAVAAAMAKCGVGREEIMRMAMKQWKKMYAGTDKESLTGRMKDGEFAGENTIPLAIPVFQALASMKVCPQLTEVERKALEEEAKKRKTGVAGFQTTLAAIRRLKRKYDTKSA